MVLRLRCGWTWVWLVFVAGSLHFWPSCTWSMAHCDMLFGMREGVPHTSAFFLGFLAEILCNDTVFLMKIEGQSLLLKKRMIFPLNQFAQKTTKSPKACNLNPIAVRRQPPLLSTHKNIAHTDHIIETFETCPKQRKTPYTWHRL
uniref:Uncharacterized protein n=1 Tax=Arundo donax TaxID=35708 RepID=A0A0A9E4G0_ARUDO